jgi:hypothetical protein
LFSVLLYSLLTAREYHVAKTGSDNNKGTYKMPLLCIQAAAKLAHHEYSVFKNIIFRPGIVESSKSLQCTEKI